MAYARPNFFDFDVTKMFADFRFRPFDVEAVWAAQRRNIEALSQPTSSPSKACRRSPAARSS